MFLKNAIPCVSCIETNNKENEFNTIFNYNDTNTEDYLREQAKVDIGCEKLVQGIVDKYTSGLVLNDWHVLLSHPGCQEQIPHTDLDPVCLKDQEDTDISCGVLVGIEDDSYLKVWPGCIRGKKRPQVQPQYLTYNRGDIIIFRGDLVHAGCAYKKKNQRIHCYADNKSLKRRSNKTYPA
jgi:hypothetical protein